MGDLDTQIKVAQAAKLAAMKEHGYGSPEHRAQRTLATLLRRRDLA